MIFDRKEYNKNYYISHKEERKKYNFIHREKIKQQLKQYRFVHKEEINQYNKQRIRFKGKQIRLDHNPRKGICVKCNRSVESNEIQLTNLHHEKYDESNPLAHTIELCVRCHMKRELEISKQKKEGFTH